MFLVYFISVILWLGFLQSIQVQWVDRSFHPFYVHFLILWGNFSFFWFCLAYILIGHKESLHHGVQHRDVPRGKPIRIVISGLHCQHTHAGGWQFSFVPGFYSQDNFTHPGTETSIGLSPAWLTLQPSPSNSDFCKKLKEGWNDQPIDWIGPLRSPV